MVPGYIATATTDWRGQVPGNVMPCIVMCMCVYMPPGHSLCDTFMTTNVAERADVGSIGSLLQVWCPSCYGSIQWCRMYANGSLEPALSADEDAGSSVLLLNISDASYGGRVYTCHCQVAGEHHTILGENVTLAGL